MALLGVVVEILSVTLKRTHLPSFILLLAVLVVMIVKAFRD